LAKELGLVLKGEDRQVSGFGTLESAGRDEVSFLANPKYLPLLSQTSAAAVILQEKFADQVDTALISENPYFDFARALSLFAEPQGCMTGLSEKAFIHPDARVHESVNVYPFAFVAAGAEVGENTSLFPGCYVGERSVVGKDCTLYPNVTLMADTVVGDRVIIHAGTVIGSDGFGFAPSEGGMEKIPQVGNVVVGDDVEIGANSAIDRAVLASTVIGKGTKIDNLVQIGHNVTIGEGSIIVAQVGISGSATIGSGVTLAGQAGISGHLKIGDGATVGPQSGVAKDIPPGAVVGGAPAMERGAFLRYLALAPRLPDMAKTVRRLEKELKELKKEIGQGEKDGD
jgi:UDP-3-O-[3-hydroxymyristoyl] glucosamine N-acyltransferase